MACRCPAQGYKGHTSMNTLTFAKHLLERLWVWHKVPVCISAPPWEVSAPPCTGSRPGGSSPLSWPDSSVLDGGGGEGEQAPTLVRGPVGGENGHPARGGRRRGALVRAGGKADGHGSQTAGRELPPEVPLHVHRPPSHRTRAPGTHLDPGLTAATEQVAAATLEYPGGRRQGALAHRALRHRTPSAQLEVPEGALHGAHHAPHVLRGPRQQG